METLTSTQEGLAPKVSLTRVNGTDAGSGKRNFVGWEYCPPQVGHSYMVFLNDDGLIKTSQVQKVITVHGRLVIKTLNSFYNVEYLLPGSLDTLSQ